MNILIVEDSSLEMRRISRMVRESVPNANLMTYTNSIEARNAIKENAIQPHVAFLDIEMPPPTGIDLAHFLVKEYPKINIIFTTAYDSYMLEAFEIFASGYLLKPFSSDDIENQLKKLRYPYIEGTPDFYAKTIGEFDFFYKGKPVNFTLARAKEALAYLIHCQGASVTKKELFSVLFEDEIYDDKKKDHMKKILRALKDGLANIDGEDILLHSRNAYAINLNKISVDTDTMNKTDYDYYMKQYSWADIN